MRCSSAGRKAAGHTCTTDTRGTTHTGKLPEGETTERVPVLEEALAIGRRVVQRGGVRVFTRVVPTQLQENDELRAEPAEVHRHRVEREATEADFRGPWWRCGPPASPPPDGALSTDSRAALHLNVGPFPRLGRADRSVRQ